MERKNETTVVTSRLPKTLKSRVDDEVDTSNYMSLSDFVRQAVREKLGRGEDKDET